MLVGVAAPARAITHIIGYILIGSVNEFVFTAEATKLLSGKNRLAGHFLGASIFGAALAFLAAALAA